MREIINEDFLNKSLDDSYTMMSRALYRRRAYKESYEGEDIIEYKGVMIEYFPYTIGYVDSELDVEGWVIKSPYYLQSNSNKDKYYLPLYCEDEDGEEVNFETLDDAKDYIDKYIVTKRGRIRIKHGDEIHYEIL